MSLHVKAAAAVAALLAGGVGAASAQPYYGYGELPPAPYQVAGGGYAGYNGGCGDRFPLLGAHAGVTVLGFDLGAGASLSAPGGGYCGGGYAPQAYYPAPPAPTYAPPPAPYYQQPAYPQPYGYEQPQYAPQYAPQGYGPPPAYPCGCEAPRY